MQAANDNWPIRGREACVERVHELKRLELNGGPLVRSCDLEALMPHLVDEEFDQHPEPIKQWFWDLLWRKALKAEGQEVPASALPARLPGGFPPAVPKQGKQLHEFFLADHRELDGEND